MVGIYKITSPSNSIYIGQSHNIDNRKKMYSKNKAKVQRKLYNSILKYEWENHIFEVIHELPHDISQTILDNYEIFYWQQYKDCGLKMLNIREPGRGGKLASETKNKITESLKGNNHALGHKHSENTILQMKNRTLGDKNPMFGKKHTEKTKELFSIQRSGKNNPQFGKPHVNSKRIIDLESGFICGSILEASKYYGVTRKTIRDWISKQKIVRYD